MADAVQTVLDAVIAQSLQDNRSLSVRAQDSAAKFHDMVWTQALHLQQLTSLSHLRSNLADGDVASSYRGSHLKKGAEVDAQEAVAEGSSYKAESLASYPQTEQLLGNSLSSTLAKLGEAVAAIQQIVKIAQTTPPQSGGHAADAPSK
jgi:hypothetical protein